MLNRLKPLRTRTRRYFPATGVSGMTQAAPADAASPEHSLHRRLLLTRAMHLQMRAAARGDLSALSILDAQGIVIVCREDSNATACETATLGTHVSQFYMAGDVAMGMLGRSLRNAQISGQDTREGWRRRASGAVFWGTTVIEAIVDDGRLLGFSHVTRPTQGPYEMQRQVRRRSRMVAPVRMNWTAWGVACRAVSP